MNQSHIFYRFKESTKIDRAIKNIPIQTQQYQIPDHQNPATIYNEKINLYMTSKAIQFIQYHNKNLEYKESQIYTLPFLPRYLFLVILTKINTNHPYLLYVNLDDNTLNFLIPFGNEQKQANLLEYFETIVDCNIPDLAAIYILVEKTVYIRKYGIINSQYSLIDCSNISNCIKRMRDIDKERISTNQKLILKKKYNEYYLNKAVNILKKYFDILEAKDYEEARLFLKESRGYRGTSKYFGKERLDTFFKSTKTIIGHLEIFIIMYELLHEARMRLLKY
jgi:hypothetical protein